MLRSVINLIRDNVAFHRFPITKQVVKFLLVGTLVTAVDFTVYVTLTRGFDWWKQHLLFANACSFIVALTTSFIVNKTWTFRDREGQFQTQYIKFFAVNLIGIATNQSIFFFLTSYLFLYDIFAKAVATAVVVVWNFSMYKFWIFRH